jgi:N utilization substance protein B
VTDPRPPRLGPEPPPPATLTAARLAAVQGLYEITYNRRPMRAVVEEALAHKEQTESPGFGHAPDPSLLKRILFGVEERSVELEILLKSVTRRRVGGSATGPEPLLRAGLLCGLYELMAHEDIDAPIIINDYLAVLRAFYGASEVGFANGILDSVARALRPSVKAETPVS